MPVESVAGRLLVASPRLLEPTFARTVILVLEHRDAGALGVVLNRPSDTRVLDVLPGWGEPVAEPALVFIGGPVQSEAGLALGTPVPDRDPAEGGAKPVLPWLASVDLSAPPETALAGIEHLRIFAGYAGWGSRQLDDELDADGWIVVDALPSDPFDAEPSSLWRRVLQRQAGSLQLLADFPRLPSMN